MKPRLELLKLFLSDDGVIFVQIDDNEQAYLKILMDEIFGRNNFLNTISVKAKVSAGASGGGEDRKLKKILNIFIVILMILLVSLTLYIKRLRSKHILIK